MEIKKIRTILWKIVNYRLSQRILLKAINQKPEEYLEVPISKK